jgi:hypothetical protein
MSQGRERSKNGVPGRSLFYVVGYNLGVGHGRLRVVIGGEREGAVCSAVHVNFTDSSTMASRTKTSRWCIEDSLVPTRGIGTILATG